MQRMYSLLQIKSVDEEKRIITGTATTPTPDRIGDIIEPLGVQFNNPMPLLWQHDSMQPVGQVIFMPPTRNGIKFEAQIADPRDASSATLADRLKEAWDSVKMKLVGAVSIGFRAIEAEPVDEKDDGWFAPLRFLKTEVLELSLVTIPANKEALIHDLKFLKSLDAPMLAASGLAAKDGERLTRPGVSGKIVKGKTAPKDAPKVTQRQTLAEQISAYEVKRAANAARMTEIMTKAADAASTLDEAESEEYDGLEVDVKKIDQHLVRMRALEEANKKAALPVLTPTADPASPQHVILPGPGRVISVKPNVEKGSAFTRLAIALAFGKGDTMKAIQRARAYPEMPELESIIQNGVINLMDGQKTAVAPATTTDSAWAGPLIAYQVMASEFIELLRPATIIGRIPGLRRVPFNIQMPATVTGSSVGWVGEQAPKPVSAMSFTTVTLRWAKAAGIIVLTDELVRFSNPAAETVVRSDLIAAMAQFLDRQFIDPTVAAVVNVSPASITNGVVAIVPTGTNEAALRADLKTLLSQVLSNNLETASGVWIMTQQQQLAISLMTNALGQASFASLQGANPTLMGYPIVASENVPPVGGSPADGYPIIFALASEIMLADDGQTVIDASNQASLQMDTTPDSPPTGSTNLVSLWQMNMTGIKAERWINWLKRRSTAVSYIQGAKYA
jgi:HK97 family phage major capsid protein/HK97 family phage prohead protease